MFKKIFFRFLHLLPTIAVFILLLIDIVNPHSFLSTPGALARAIIFMCLAILSHALYRKTKRHFYTGLFLISAVIYIISMALMPCDSYTFEYFKGPEFIYNLACGSAE